MSATAAIPITADIGQLLASDNPEATVAAIQRFAAHARDTADARKIAQARAALNRWVRSEHPTPVQAALDESISTLGSELSRLRLQRADERTTREAGELAAEILELLSTKRRPKDLIEATGADPAQVARAINRLRDSGVIVEVSGPTGADGRGRWYVHASKVTARTFDDLARDATANSLVAIAAVDTDGAVHFYAPEPHPVPAAEVEQLAEALHGA